MRLPHRLSQYLAAKVAVASGAISAGIRSPEGVTNSTTCISQAISPSGELRRTLPALTTSLPITIIYFAVLGIILNAAGAHGLDLSAAQTSGWIAVLYGFPTLIALVLTIRTRQPLLFTGYIFAVIFFVPLGNQLTFSELAGATILAGALVLVAAILGVTRRIGPGSPARLWPPRPRRSKLPARQPMARTTESAAPHRCARASPPGSPTTCIWSKSRSCTAPELGGHRGLGVQQCEHRSNRP